MSNDPFWYLERSQWQVRSQEQRAQIDVPNGKSPAVRSWSYCCHGNLIECS